MLEGSCYRRGYEVIKYSMSFPQIIRIFAAAFREKDEQTQN